MPSEQLALVRAEEWPVFQGESYEEHVSTWLEVDHSMQGHYWMLGAVAASLVKRYGEDVTGKFASDVGSSRSRVYEYGQTYRTWQNYDRSESLSFKHHQIAARTEDPQKAIEVAEQEELSTRELEEFAQTGELPERNVHFSSESAEWYTPEHIIASVIAVLGTIELDPCADPDRAVPARRHFTKEMDGLSPGNPWTGKVYMNPPYRKGKETQRWIEKLLAEYQQGGVTEAVVLVPARTDTEWFTLLRDYRRCFIRGRLRFSGATGTPHENSAPFPSAAFYLGPPEGSQRFAEVFGALGDVFERVRNGSD